MEAEQLSNQSLAVKLAVKLPPSAEGNLLSAMTPALRGHPLLSGQSSKLLPLLTSGGAWRGGLVDSTSENHKNLFPTRKPVCPNGKN